jgi:hypothetical protein
MTQLFNFQDPKFNEGFSFDTSKLTKEQLEHFYAIINARGITQVNDAGEPQRHYAYVDIAEQTLGWYTSHIGKQIAYPELCSGAVQLESSMWAYISSAWAMDMYNYCISAGLLYAFDNQNAPCYGVWRNGQLEYGHKVKPKDAVEVYWGIFYQKLKGIYPVVRETEKQSADNAQGKRYLKGKVTGVIVEWVSDIDASYGHNLFKGCVVSIANSSSEIGEENTYGLEDFEPCDYTPNIKVVETVEQPKETITDCGKKTLIDNPTIADHIGSHFNLAFDYRKALVNENTSLRQENAQLKEQVEELTQQVFDLNRLGANFERENAQLKQQQENTWSEKETLKNALAKIAELKDRNEALNKLNNEYEVLNGKLKSELEAANKWIAAQVIGNTEPRSLRRHP